MDIKSLIVGVGAGLLLSVSTASLAAKQAAIERLPVMNNFESGVQHIESINCPKAEDITKKVINMDPQSETLTIGGFTLLKSQNLHQELKELKKSKQLKLSPLNREGAVCPKNPPSEGLHKKPLCLYEVVGSGAVLAVAYEQQSCSPLSSPSQEAKSSDPSKIGRKVN